MRSLVLCLAVMAFLFAHAHAAHSTENGWQKAIAEAKGQTLVLAVQPMEGHTAIAAAFQQRFPGIKVELTQMPANKFVPRVLAEQQNGIYAWDAWLGQVSNIAFYLVPVGGLERIDKYLLLPEVTDPSHWRAPQFLYAYDLGPYIFVFSQAVEKTIYANTRTLNGLQIKTPDDLLDPRLTGKLGVRTATHPGAGAVTLAALMKNKGVGGKAFARELLTRQGVTFYDNPRQITTAVMRGEKGVIVGAGVDTIDKCQLAGGCREVVTLPFGMSVMPRAAVILKNPPHPAAATVWTNGLLSKEGQEAFVREMAETMVSGAVSMRTDVPPALGHETSLPDYQSLDQYIVMGTKEGEDLVNEAMDLYQGLDSQ